MTTRECMERNIASLTEQLADAVARGDQDEVTELQDELSHEQEGLEILLEGRADIDVEYHSSDPIQNYLHKKMRF